jgi:hypothetical protein
MIVTVAVIAIGHRRGKGAGRVSEAVTVIPALVSALVPALIAALSLLFPA